VYNGSRLGAGGDFYHYLSYEAESSNLRKTVKRSTEPPLVPNRCYGQVFCPTVPQDSQTKNLSMFYFN